MVVATKPSLGVNFYPFQRDYLNDSSQFVGVMWARGNGKSKLTALKIVLDSFQNEVSKKPSDWLIVSATAGQAKEALTHVAGWAQLIYAIAVKIEIIETEVEFKTEGNKERYTLYEIRIGNGTKIMALSASPAAIRGYTANVWWDEACFFANDHDMWAALQHCTRGYLKMIVTSTPIGGPERKFYQIIHDQTIVNGIKLWSIHVADIARAVADGRPYDIAVQKALAKDPYRWAQEMDLAWLDGEQTWFKQELIGACEDPEASAIGHGYTRGRRVYIGNDLGLRGHKWVAWVMEATDDFAINYEDKPNGQKVAFYTGRLITREVVVLDRSDFDDHDREIARLMHKYNVMRICVDRGGMGEKPVFDYQKLYGSMVEGILFNIENKGAMALLGLELMTDRRSLLPENCPEISEDFRKLQRVVSPAGAIRFNAIADSNGHSDRCWAFLMCLNAAVTPVQEIEYEDGGVKDSFTEMESFTYD
jgi:phage FluMu gp28-like protein